MSLSTGASASSHGQESTPHPTADRAFRLATDVRPLRYDARLRIDVAAHSFEGRLTIDVELARAGAELVLHGLDLAIESVVATIGGHACSPIHRAEPASQTLVFTFSDTLPVGVTSLQFVYRGRFCEGLRGLYLAGPEIAVTQFEAADARRVFPCFDEPGFKAPWRLTVEAAADYQVLGNGIVEQRTLIDGYQSVRFKETPPLPTYLIALAVGRFDVARRNQPERDAVEIATWAVPEKRHLADFAQDVAENVLPRLEAWFGLPYAFGKLDQIGLPDFEAGAMENAGLVTYREVALLLDTKVA